MCVLGILHTARLLTKNTRFSQIAVKSRQPYIIAANIANRLHTLHLNRRDNRAAKFARLFCNASMLFARP